MPIGPGAAVANLDDEDANKDVAWRGGAKDVGVVNANPTSDIHQ